MPFNASFILPAYKPKSRLCPFVGEKVLLITVARFRGLLNFSLNVVPLSAGIDKENNHVIVYPHL